MRTHLTRVQISLATHAAVNGGLCLLIGAMQDGLRGSQAGLVAGIVLAALPTVWRDIVRVIRPDGVLRLCVRELGVGVTRLAAIVIDGLGGVLAPLAGLMRGPVTRVRWAASRTASSMSLILGTTGRAVATPLGLANLAALLAIGCELAQFDFAALALFVALTGMILVLLVSASEKAV